MDSTTRYDWAARAAAQIVNLTDPAAPKVEQFGRILSVILEVMAAAEEERRQARMEPSIN